mgnify:CR=1 FL=1
MQRISYADNIIYQENVHEVAFREGTIEENEDTYKIFGVRIYANNCLSIASSNRVNDFNKLFDIALKNLKECRTRINWFEGEYYTGKNKFGRESDLKYLKELVKNIATTYISKGLKVEVIGICREILKEINVLEQGSTAIEHRILYELYIYPYTLYMGRIASTGHFIVDSSINGLYDKASNIIDESLTNIVSQLNARKLNPAYLGKWPVVLTGNAAPVFYHELIHLLQGDEPVKLRIGTMLYRELNIVEDPFYPGPLQRFFDDELYPAWRRRLVEKGVVVDYLHTRTTLTPGSKPGNARGLFTRSKPLHHQLIVGKGDWNFDEMLEESKRCIIVRNIVEAHLSGDYIRIIPEEAWVYEKKRDSTTPVKIYEIAVPLSKLGEVIVGLGRTLHERASFEKNHLVYEVAPDTLIEARIS